MQETLQQTLSLIQLSSSFISRLRSNFFLDSSSLCLRSRPNCCKRAYLGPGGETRPYVTMVSLYMTSL